jgi:hypothetical protein
MRTLFSLSILALAITLGAIAQDVQQIKPATPQGLVQLTGDAAIDQQAAPVAKLEDLVRWAIFGSTAPTYQVAMAVKGRSFHDPGCTECLHGWQYCDLGGPVLSPVPCGRVIHKKQPW